MYKDTLDTVTFQSKLDTSNEFINNPNFDDLFKKVEKVIRKSFTQKKKKVRNSTILSNLSVFDFRNMQNMRADQQARIHTSELFLENMEQDFLDMINTQAKILRIDGTADGFFIFSNILTVQSQIHWAKTSLEVFSTSTHTNLTNLNKSKQPPEQSNRAENKFSDLWLESVNANDISKFFDLRWVSLGYHYNWTSRKYEENLNSDLPPNFSSFCKQLANCIPGLDVTPEAAIINYYPCGTSMSGHIDDAEHNMDEPIVSISLGCDAIFLVGGHTKSVEPIPILLKSGDVVIMSGESRSVYHGVAYVLPESEFSNFENDDPVVQYLNQARINLNVRRVALEDGQWLDKHGSGASMQLST